MMALLFALVMATPPSVLSVHTLFYEKEWTTEEMQTLAVKIATDHGLKAQKFLDVVNCESGWNRKAVGDNGTSFGLVQLHYPERDWGLTEDEAYDPEIALETMALAWERDEAWRWTCWKPS